MNAVKRCLALVAATLVVGACSGDPTADLAGTNPTIRTSPGAVWMQSDKTATITVEAIDATGSPLPGSWTATTTGPLTADLDEDYQETNGGAPVGNASQFVVSASVEGEGLVIITGTGGVDTVPVRVAPSNTGMNLTFTAPAAPVADTVTVPLNSAVTVGVPAGVRFTSTTTVRIMNGPLTTNVAPFAVIGYSIAADSQNLTFTPGPNSTGQIEITGIANVSTPTLKAPAVRSHTTIKTDVFDTNSTSRLTVTSVNPVANDTINAGIGDTVTVTLPATYRFSPNSVVAFFRDTTINGNATRVASDGLAAPVVTSVSADSGTLKFIPAPGARGRPRFSNIRVRANTSFVFGARSLTAVKVPNLSSLAATFSSSNPAANTPVTITMPANFKFRPTSAVTIAGGAPFTARVISRSADSNSIVIAPVPGTSGTVSITNIKFSPLASLNLTLSTSGAITTAAVTDQGSDDPTNVGNASFNAPTVTGQLMSYFDVGSFAFADPTAGGSVCDNQGGTGNTQWVTVVVGATGNYSFSLNWTGGSDLDFALAVKDGAYNGTGGAGSCPEFIPSSTNGLNVNKPEAFSVTALAAGTYVLYIKDYPGDQSGSGVINVVVTKN